MSFYDSIADYYDFIFPFNSMHLDFIKGSIQGPYDTKTVLDIGCGTGDLVIALSTIGFTVTGIDYDHEMLNRAEKKAKNESVVLRQMDMRGISDIFEKASFDVVVCFGNTLVHLTDVHEIEAFLKQAREVLKDNGKLLLQILNYDYLLDRAIRQLPMIENDVIKFARYYDYDAARGLVRFRTILTVKNTQKEIENEILLYPMRRHELDAALSGAGFVDRTYYGDFDRSELKAEKLPLVVEAS